MTLNCTTKGKTHDFFLFNSHTHYGKYNCLKPHALCNLASICRSYMVSCPALNFLVTRLIWHTYLSVSVVHISLTLSHDRHVWPSAVPLLKAFNTLWQLTGVLWTLLFLNQQCFNNIVTIKSTICFTHTVCKLSSHFTSPYITATNKFTTLYINSQILCFFIWKLVQFYIF